MSRKTNQSCIIIIRIITFLTLGSYIPTGVYKLM